MSQQNPAVFYFRHSSQRRNFCSRDEISYPLLHWLPLHHLHSLPKSSKPRTTKPLYGCPCSSSIYHCSSIPPFVQSMRHPVALLLDFCPELLHLKSSREEKKKKKKNTTTKKKKKPLGFLHKVALFLNSTDYPYTQQACNCFLHSASTQLIRVLLFPRTTRPPSPSPFYSVLSRYSTKKSNLFLPPLLNSCTLRPELQRGSLKRCRAAQMKELDNDRSSPLLRRWVFFSRNTRHIRESRIIAREQNPTGPTHTDSQLDESVCSRLRRFLGFGAHCNSHLRLQIEEVFRVWSSMQFHSHLRLQIEDAFRVWSSLQIHLHLCVFEHFVCC